MEFIVSPGCVIHTIFLPISNGMPKYNLKFGRPGIECGFFSIIFNTWW